MRKLTYAIASIAFLLAGCSQEESIMENKGELVTLNYNINLNDGVQSRAGGETTGYGVNNLLCLVFEKGGTTALKREVVEVTSGTIQYTPVLFKNIEYRIVFWAYHKNGSDSCYTITDQASVTTNENYDKNHFANDLYKNAFTAVDDVKIVNDASPTSVTLTRPFGQINVYTTKSDWDNAKALGSTPTTSTLTLTGYQTTYDAFNQKWIDGETSLTLTSTPSETNYCLASEYVFANGNKKCGVEVKDQNSKSIYSYTIESLPIGKNQRTNIKPEEGSAGLMTGSVSYTVQVSDGFSTEDNNQEIN